MRKIVALVAILNPGFVFAYTENHFNIAAVGASNNTKTVFIDVVETASDTECANKKHFKLADTDPHADRFFAAALTAQAQGTQLALGYESDECLHGGIVPRVFKTVK